MTKPEFAAGDRVRHAEYGEGAVSGVEKAPKTGRWYAWVDFPDSPNPYTATGIRLIWLERLEAIK